jgi:hypothetical protein
MTRLELETLAWNLITRDLPKMGSNGERASHLADVFQEIERLARENATEARLALFQPKESKS